MARVFNHYSQPVASRTHLNPDTHVNLELSTTTRGKQNFCRKAYQPDREKWHDKVALCMSCKQALTCYTDLLPARIYALPKCPITQMSVTEMSCYRNVLLPKRPLPKCPLPKCLHTTRGTLVADTDVISSGDPWRVRMTISRVGKMIRL